jgi:hypothetical protein
VSAVSRLDRAGATRRAQRARDCMMTVAEAIDTLTEIQDRQDWLALGYKTWSEYCEKEFGPDRLKLTPEQRGQVVAVLVASGMPKRRVAAALGVTEGTIRNDFKKRRVEAPEVRNDYALPPSEPQVSDGQTAAEAASRPADGGTDTTSAVPPAAGPGATQPTGEADRPGPAVNPTGITEDDVRPASDPVLPPASPQGVDEAAAPAEPEELTSPLSGEADPVPDETGVTRPAPDPSDPAALIQYFADLWGDVDFEAAGPLLTRHDMQILNQSLISIANGVEALVKWRERAQP